MKKYVLLVLLTMVLLCCSCGNQPGADSPIISESSLPLGDPALYSWPEPSQPNQNELNAYAKKFTSSIRSLNPNKMEDFSVTISQYMTEDKVYTTTDKDLIKKWVEFFKSFKISGVSYDVPAGATAYSFTYCNAKTKEEKLIFRTWYPRIFFNTLEDEMMLQIDNADEVEKQWYNLLDEMGVE